MEVQQVDVLVHVVGELECPQMVIDVPDHAEGQVDPPQVRPV